MSVRSSAKKIGELVDGYAVNEYAKRDKALTLVAVGANPTLLNFSDEVLKDDDEVVLTAVRASGQALRFASERCRADKKIVLFAISSFPKSYAYALPPASEDEEVVLAVAKHGGDSVCLLSENSLRNEKVALAAVGRNPSSIRYFPESVRSDKKVALAVLKGDRTAVNYLADEAFRDREVFECATRMTDGKIAANVFTNDAPLGLFNAARRWNVKVNLAAQNLNALTLDRDKLYALLDVAEGVFPRKNELIRRFIDEDDKEMLDALLKKGLITPSKGLDEVKYASAHGKIRVLPLLLAFSRGAVRTERSESERDKLIRSLKRKSTVGVNKFRQNVSDYLNDREVVWLAAETDGTILQLLNDSPFINDDRLIDLCLKSYVVKNSMPPLLKGLDNIKLTKEQAIFACKKDGRNYFYLPEEYKRDKYVAAEAARLDDKVFSALPEDLKSDPVVLSKRLR